MRTKPTLAPKAIAQVQSSDLAIRLTGLLSADDDGLLAQDLGWLEYRLSIVNLGRGPVMIRNVKLLTLEGRYLDSAADYAQLAEPPDVAIDVAGEVAKRGAGIAAGQVIPYGGTIVGILSGAASSVSAQGKAKARRDFALRRIKNVELAPGGRIRGSAFLPRVRQPQALVVDWERDRTMGRVALPFDVAGKPQNNR